MRIISRLKNFFLDFLFPGGPDKFKAAGRLTVEQAAVKIRRAESDSRDWLALFDYRDQQAKGLVWEIKYKNNQKAARLAAALLYEEILAQIEYWRQFENFREPLLVPVPLSEEKLEKRGFNQTELLAREIERLDGGRNFRLLTGILKKTKDTPDQTSLKTKTARLKNLKGCFAVARPEEIKGRNIIVLDDVVTTSATLAEIRRTLKKAGARKVKGAAIAH